MAETVPSPRARALAPLAVVGSLAVGVNLAVAQPVLDLLGRNPEFFADRRAPTLDVVLLAVVLAVVVPLVAAAAVLALARVAPRAAAVVHGALLGLLGAVFCAQLLDGGLPWPLPLPLAAAAGAGLVVAYRRSPAVTTVLRAGVLVPVLVVGLFLVSSPAVAGGATDDASAADVRVGTPAPVVVVVLDELPTTSLLGPDGDIDAARFPGFARLAAASTWYPNAATPYDHTHRIIPAVLTGGPWREGRAPVAASYPDNLFTLLADDYDVLARERVSWLCPPSVCPLPAEDAASRLAALAGDVGVVASHVVVPEGLRGGLPPLDGAWGGFAAAAGDGDAADEADGADEAEGGDDTTRAPDGAGDLSFAAFLDSFAAPAASAAPDMPLLRYYHVMGPHHPFRSLPDGTTYPQDLPMPAYDDGPPGEVDEAYITQGHQRHLLQTGAVDGLVDDLLDTLEAWPAYDDALVVVLGDHGVSFRAGQSLRLTRAGNVDELAYVPLFVKAPGQRDAGVDQRPALISDLMATVVDVLDLEGAPVPDGVSLLADDHDPDRARTLRSLLGSDHPLPPDGGDRARALAQQTRRFPAGGWDPVWRPGPYDALVGEPVGGLVEGDPEPVTASLTEPETGEPPPLPADASGRSLPVLVDGRASGPTVGAGTWLALAVDDRVAATALVHDREAGPDRFTAMVHPDAYADGVATPILYRIVERGGDVGLRPLDPSADAD